MPEFFFFCQTVNKRFAKTSTNWSIKVWCTVSLKKRIWLICFTQNIYRPYPTGFVNFSLSSRAFLQVFDIKNFNVERGCRQKLVLTSRTRPRVLIISLPFPSDFLLYVNTILYCTVAINITSLAASRGSAPRLMASTASSEGSTRIMTSPSPEHNWRKFKSCVCFKKHLVASESTVCFWEHCQINWLLYKDYKSRLSS